MASCSGCGSSGELMSRKRKRTCVEDEEANARRTDCFELLIDLQELFSVDDLLCGDHDDYYQVCEEQGSSHFDSCTADSFVIVSQNESEEDDTCWLVDASEEEDPSNSVSENQISVGDDLISTVIESTDIQLEEEGTDQNDIIPMDGASYFQSDECSNLFFHFENQYNCTADSCVIVSQNENEDAQLEDDRCWLVDALVEYVDSSLSAANESTDIQLEEGTEQNGSAPAFLEQHQDDDDIIPIDGASYFQSDECS